MSTMEKPITVPDGFTLHTENTAHILLSSDEAFLNPVQEFNRDLSVASIRVWSEQMDKIKEMKWRESVEKKAKKRKVSNNTPTASHDSSREVGEQPVTETVASRPERLWESPKFVLLEPLAATGLRSIRYAKEIPLIKYIVANDLSLSAIEAMKRNIEINGLALEAAESSGGQNAGKVRVKEGDARTLMYMHREEKDRVDVIDLDPYGTAAPFIDAAVQCVKDGGLLCITCTDLSVLATNNYPEKCFSNYGGLPMKAEYCHEAALRLVLHSVSTSAARYGRYIEPLLSLSIDFYVRLFIRVKTSPLEVKKVLAKTAMYYICSFCQAHYEQPLGKVTEKKHEPSGNINYLFKLHSGPTVAEKCPECDSTLHMAGPMWSGPIHDTDFILSVLEHLEGNEDKYGTAVRMKGMLTVAKEELHTPFYFTPSKVASFFHCATPSLDDVASALLHAGHKISRSHACPGSLKTTAARSIVHSVFRSWIKLNPVKMSNVSESSPTRQLLASEPSFEADFKRHPESVTPSSKVKLVRYQENPTSHWGPGTKAAGTKRKRMTDNN